VIDLIWAWFIHFGWLLIKGAAAQVVGWPSVSQNRRNALTSRGKFIKVAIAGAPYQRKVDFEAYTGYDQLLTALQDKFTSHFTVRRKCVHRRNFSAACLVFLVGCCLSMMDRWVEMCRPGGE
jgi:hypothetical protein